VTAVSSARKPQVVLADDQATTLALLGRLLEREFDVVAMVGDGQALVDAVAHLSPDVIVTDVSMPVLDGIEAAERILGTDPDARVVFVTVHTDPPLVRRGLAIGGLGYVAKVWAADELVPAVWAALRGERWGTTGQGEGNDHSGSAQS
jgi:DNA-binding NarL/FixJ family response regulator